MTIDTSKMINTKGDNLSKQEFLDIVTNDLTQMETLHDEQMQRIQEWISKYEGEPYGNEVEGRSQMVWKLAKKQGESLISNLIKPFVSTNEIVEMKQKTEPDRIKVKIYEKLNNHFWSNDFPSNRFMKTLSRVAVKEGTAIFRVGWEKVDKSIVVETDQMDDILAQKLIQAGVKVEQVEENKWVVTRPNVVINRPVSKMMRSENIYIDATADDPTEIKSLINEYVITISDAKKQPHLYDAEAVAQLEAIMDQEDDRKRNEELERYKDGYSGEIGEYNPTDMQFIDKNRRKIRIYEYWGEYDMDGDGINESVVGMIGRYTQDTDRVVLSLKKNPLPFNDIPFVIIPLYDTEFSVYGRALIDVIDEEQRAMTAIIRGMLDNMSQSNNGQTFFKKNALDAVNFNRLKRGDPYIEINTTDSINTAVMNGNFNQFPQSTFNFLAVIEQQADSLTGISKMLQGIPGSDMKSSASNFASMMSQSQIRLLDITNNVTDGLKKMFTMWTYMAMEYLSEDEIQQITGISIMEEKMNETRRLQQEFNLIDTETGEPTVPEDTFNKAMLLIMKEVQDIFDKKDVKFDMKMRVGTDGLKQIRINEINMLMQQAAPLVQTGVVPADAMKMLFADMAENMDRPDIARKALTFQPQPDPMQQATAEMQLEEMRARASKDHALAANAMARTEETQIKAALDAASLDADLSNKYADVASKAENISNERVKTSADAYAKIKQADKPVTQGGSK